MWPPAPAATASSLCWSDSIACSSANNSLTCSRSWRAVCKFDNKVWCEYRPGPSSFNMRSSTRSLMIAPRSSAGFKSGDEPGHSLLLKKSTPLCRSRFCVARALKHGALSCRKQTSWTSIARCPRLGEKGEHSQSGWCPVRHACDLQNVASRK